jgi:hypothetical protein
MTLCPGDLVTLKYHTHYFGIDLATNLHFNVPAGSIGIFMESLPGAGAYLSHDLVLTNGRTVSCAPGVWSVLHETR